MSIAINPSKCVGCGRCIEVCPGNLIKLVDEKAVAVQSRPERNHVGLRSTSVGAETDIHWMSSTRENMIQECGNPIVEDDSHGFSYRNCEGTEQLRKAVIKREKDCWGCTSCLKECKTGAIAFFLGADIGGRGSVLSVSDQGDIRTWTVTAPDKSTKTIVVNRKESNKY